MPHVCYAFFALMSLTNVHHFLSYILLFSVNVRWLTALCYANHAYPIVECHVIYSFFLFTYTFSGTQLGHETWPWYMYGTFFVCYKVRTWQ